MTAALPGMVGLVWDRPQPEASDRAWLRDDLGTVVGFFLDYGPDHYRSPHDYCTADRPCRDCQPGNVLVCAYPAGPSTPTASRYVVTRADAVAWIEGAVPAAR